MKQLDLFRPEPPPFQAESSDPELWAALFVKGPAVEELLQRRHGDDEAAKLANVRGFLPPNTYTLTKEQAQVPWAGRLNVIEYRLELSTRRKA